MSEALEEIHRILTEFEAEIAHVRSIWSGKEKDNPSFEVVSEENWKEKYHEIDA
jgi:hypothetical protein